MFLRCLLLARQTTCPVDSGFLVIPEAGKAKDVDVETRSTRSGPMVELGKSEERKSTTGDAGIEARPLKLWQ